MFHTLNWNWILLVPLSSLWNSASFSVEQTKSEIKLELLNWPPWITASATNMQHSYLATWTLLGYCFHNFKKTLLHHTNLLSLNLLLGVRKLLEEVIILLTKFTSVKLEDPNPSESSKQWNANFHSIWQVPLKGMERTTIFFTSN